MASNEANTCGFKAASMADSGRLPSSSKSSPSSAAGVSPPSVVVSPSALGSAGFGGGGGGGGGTGRLNSGAGAAPFTGVPIPLLPMPLFSGWPSGPTGGGTLAGWPSGPAPYMASRSIISRSRTLPSLSSSRHTVSASKVSGLSHKAPIISSRPASMRLAMAISPSRDNSSTLPISSRYMRTGSSVRSYCSPDLAVVASALEPSATGTIAPPSSPSSASSLSMTLMPISLSIAIVSSICSDEVLSD